MSSADLDRDLSGSVVPQDSQPVELAPAAVSPDEGWQTVDCPGTVSADAIPRAEPEPSSPSVTAELTVELTQLKQENGELRDRTTQLEQDFTQAQIEWQLETARLLHQVSESTPPEQAQAVQTQLTSAHEQLSRLFQELELCHQTAQRQQILVETLTEQLESGQERIAELERDCATTQQRYNEQVQQRLQAEAACRDLRTRLNRQQQHTLQFKVALEKCLEMPAPSGRSIAELDLGPTLAAPPVEPLTAESLIAPQSNSPVQPWSAPVNQPSWKPALAHLLQDPPSFEQLVQEPSIASEPVIQEPMAQSAGDLMNLIFPSSEPPVAASEANDFFDVKPLLETDAGAIAPALSDQIQQASDTLWQDLTALIDPPTSTKEFSVAAPEASPIAVTSSVTLQGLGAAPAGEPESSPNPPLFSGSPSPVVYPLRPTKKRESLAAVELPTFPRKIQ